MIAKNAVGFAILCSLASFDYAAAPAASGPTVIAIHGTVVDETGTPVPNVRVAAVEGTGLMRDFFTQSDAAGKFAFDLPARFLVSFVASDTTGERMDFLGNSPAREQQRLVLRESRAIPVIVVDGKDRPVAGATVFAGFYLFNSRLAPRPMLEQSTGADGKAILRLPRDMPLEHVYALKPGTGFDYALYNYRSTDRRIPLRMRTAPRDPNQRAADDDRPIKFVLGGVHTLRVHLVDGRHRPLPGVRIEVTRLQRPNRGGPANLPAMQEFGVISDLAGIAEFRMIPADATGRAGLRSTTMDYFVHDEPTLNPGDPETDLTLVATQIPVLRVQVTGPDGRPALGAQIHSAWRQYAAHGIGQLLGIERSYDAAGGIEVTSFMNDAYCVVSATSKGFVSTTEARVARMDEPMRPVHFVLQPAVHVRGTLTWGKDHRPDANEILTLIERDEDRYSKLPEEERLPRTLPLADRAHVAIDIPHRATTNAQGRFDFEVPPGRYVIGVGTMYLSDEFSKAKDTALLFDEATREFTTNDQKQIEINLEREDLSSAASRDTAGPRRLDRIRLQVTYADGRPAPEARTYFVLCPVASDRKTTPEDLPGRSHILLSGDAYCVLSATSDGFASAVVARVARAGHSAEPVHLILKPAARVHGRLTVGKGRLPLARQRFCVIQRDEDNYSKLPAGERLPQFDRITANIPIRRGTDAEGRFEFSAAPGRYVLVREPLFPGGGTNPEDLEALVVHGAKEFQVKDEKDIEINAHQN